MKIPFFVLMLAASTAHAQQAQDSEVWQCIGSDGKRYSSPKNVKSDPCLNIRESDVGAPPSAAPAPVLAPSEPWGIIAFCKAQKSQACVPSTDGSQSGTLNGVPFTLYADSASVDAVKDKRSGSLDLRDAWDVGCRRDKMTNRKSCSVNRGDLYVFVYQSELIKVSIGAEHFPGSATSIRVGSKRFDTTDRDGDFPQSTAILTSMKDGTQVVTRFMKWPYRQWVDDEFDVYGAQVAVKVAQWLLKTGKAI
jgi:hypothetical protein